MDLEETVPAPQSDAPNGAPATPTSTPASGHRVALYTSEELARRIGEGSLDPQRLAATLLGLHEMVTGMASTVDALARWVNAQIAAQETAASAAAGAQAGPKRK